MHQQRLAQVAKILLKCKDKMTPYLYSRYLNRFENIDKGYSSLDKELSSLEKELVVLARHKP